MTLDDDIIPLRLGPQDRIRIGGVHYRCLKTDDAGHILFERIDQVELTEFFSHADFERAKEILNTASTGTGSRQAGLSPARIAAPTPSPTSRKRNSRRSSGDGNSARGS